MFISCVPFPVGVSNLSAHVLLLCVCVCVCGHLARVIHVLVYPCVVCSLLADLRKSTIWGGVVRPFTEPLRFAYYVVLPDKLGGIPVARGGSRGSVEPPFRVTGNKYFSHTPHITIGISSSVQSC